MVSFNEVFITIKKHCRNHTTQVGTFDRLARESQMPISKLAIHLEELQNHGLIKYSLNQYIYITSLGQKLDKFIK